jgi:hypothetical protein
VPGTYAFVDDPRCDPHTITLTHELGIKPPFPADEAIAAGATPTQMPITCPLILNDPLIPDYIVTITNLTTIKWTDLFFVADKGVSVGNADGTINEGDAFKIDTGLGAGINTPLLSESLAADLIFEPAETWTFIVIDFASTLGPVFPTFGSIAVGKDSTGVPDSWASIVAIPVDEPRLPIGSTGTLIALGLAAGAFARRRKKR